MKTPEEVAYEILMEGTFSSDDQQKHAAYTKRYEGGGKELSDKEMDHYRSLESKRQAAKNAPYHTADDDKHFSRMSHKFSHGQGHTAYHDASESKMTVQDAHNHLKSRGYKTSKFRGENINGYKTWTYHKPGGPYTDHHASIDSTHGTHARHVSFKTVTDKS